MSAPFVHRLRGRYAECDMQGHTYNAHYLTWLDIAHTELLRHAFGAYQEILDLGVDFVVADARLRFRGSARFDDEVDVVLEVERLGDTSLTSAWRVERDGELLVEGSIRHVCVGTEDYAKKTIPDFMRSALS